MYGYPARTERGFGCLTDRRAGCDHLREQGTLLLLFRRRGKFATEPLGRLPLLMRFRVDQELPPHVLPFVFGPFQSFAKILSAPPCSLEQLEVNVTSMRVELPELVTFLAAHTPTLEQVYRFRYTSFAGSRLLLCGVLVLGVPA
jgi:hypothetical protein